MNDETASIVSPAGAIYAFAAWLTCRDEAITFGATHDAAAAAQLADAFCKSQGWGGPDGEWTKSLKPYPTTAKGTANVTNEPLSNSRGGT